jgi:hypothetical protein
MKPSSDISTPKKIATEKTLETRKECCRIKHRYPELKIKWIWKIKLRNFVRE